MLSIISYLAAGEYFQAIIIILSRCFVVFCCLPIHEFSHGYIAYKLGDTTAKSNGRLTLNPLAHLNPIGAVMIFLFGIGYANPVPVNPNNFKKPKQGMALVALAGPVSNLLMACISVFLYYAVASITSGSIVTIAIGSFFYYAAMVNVTLAVFNLFPIPPLDGSKILAVLIPDSVYYKYMRYERYVMIALLLLLFLGVLDTPISWISSKLMYIISIIPSLIFG